MLRINFLFLVIIALFLGRGIFGMLSDGAISYDDKSVVLAENFGILMMLANGSFHGSKLFRVALFALGATVLGAIFKVMHLNGGDQIILLADMVLFVSYFIHFLGKKPKIRLDYLKVLTLGSMLVVVPIVLLHLVPVEQREIFLVTSHIIFWLTFVDFIYTYGRLLLRD